MQWQTLSSRFDVLEFCANTCGSHALTVCLSVRPSVRPSGQSISEEHGGQSGAEVVILTNELLGEHDRKLRERADGRTRTASEWNAESG